MTIMTEISIPFFSYSVHRDMEDFDQRTAFHTEKKQKWFFRKLLKTMIDRHKITTYVY